MKRMKYTVPALTRMLFEQFLALMNTHCKSSEEALTMLNTLCYNLMMTCGIDSMDSQMLNGHGISMQLQGIDIAEKRRKEYSLT